MSERIKKLEKCWLVLVQWVAKNSKTNKKNPEAVSRRYSAKKRFLKFLQNSHGKTCAGDFVKKNYRSQARNTIY